MNRTRTSRTRRGVAVALLSPALLAAAGNPVSDAVEVVEVEVPVQVLVDGRPLRGLTRDDFKLVAAGREREILGFSEVDLRDASPAGSPAAREARSAPPPLAARRHFLLLFDLSFAGTPKVFRARDAALELVRNRVGEADVVSVATFSVARGVTVLVGFTPDRQQVVDAIESLGRPQVVEGLQDPLGLVFVGPERTAPGGGGGGGAGSGSVSEVAASDSLAEELSRASLGSSFKVLTEELTALAESLRPVAGRKHVLYLSEGADSSLLLGIGRGDSFREQERIQAMNEASMRGEVWNVNSVTRFGDTGALVDFESMLKEFVRAGATIQAIDVGGLRAEHDGRVAGEDTLFMMADKTGGELIRNHNDLERAMARVLGRTEVSYLLTFAAPVGGRGGRYERIKVKLRDGRRGTTVLHRPGYFTPVPYAERSPDERRAEAARWILDDRELRDLAVGVRVGEPGIEARGKRRVPIEVEVGASGGDVEIYVYALAGGGRIADYWSATVATGGSPGGASISRQAELRLAPGAYDLRVLARDGVAGAMGTRSVRLEIPAAPSKETEGGDRPRFSVDDP